MSHKIPQNIKLARGKVSFFGTALNIFVYISDGYRGIFHLTLQATTQHR